MKKVRAGTETETTEEHRLLAHSLAHASAFIYVIQTYVGMMPPTVEWAFPHHPGKTTAHRHSYRAV